ncbi:putative MAT alpha mating-type protein [Aspergillus clavatus NRRL 1]|uniref:MAT alpha mating-type protein, putative n=1 Tax=Aspergillus clavatus (strain ATCC 1007 / CBS 513.65 / DSM 816 / NCTC 3887 / NRRL 1 / QM 1276 / 107) TaxID=344612 RepID=A1CJ84_ASPCL|nr:MAT alpha mating-type protein, putative [Aspergillus clavatus NRRL 1]EAW09208.1 MAT alpha mating-type protein, putative [Aspergillus clavatus NRRL 1]
MEAANSPLERAFNTFLLSMPAEQLEELLKYLQDARAQSNNTVLLPAASVAAISTSPLSDNRRDATVTPRATSRTSVVRSRRGQEGRKRPLNSFIAFRSFYSVMFPDLTQKAKSGILRFLWQNDPFKAKWAILAKAYSTVRDNHENEVSLDQFLELTTNFIGIVEPTRYLDEMGWQLTFDDQQQYTMAKAKVISTSDASTSTNYSANDIVTHCYDAGLVSRNECRHNESNDDKTATMAFAAQSTMVIDENHSLQVNCNDAIVTTYGSATPEMYTSSPHKTDETPSPNPIDADGMADDNALEIENVPAVHNSQHLGLFPFAGSGINLDSMQFPGYNQGEALSFLDPNLSAPMGDFDPLMEPPFGVFDINQFINF